MHFLSDAGGFPYYKVYFKDNHREEKVECPHCQFPYYKVYFKVTYFYPILTTNNKFPYYKVYFKDTKTIKNITADDRFHTIKSILKDIIWDTEENQFRLSFHTIKSILK